MGANPWPLPFPPLVMMTSCWRFVGTPACTRTDALQVLGMLGSGAVQADDLITPQVPTDRRDRRC
jgi:hypothetical protein